MVLPICQPVNIVMKVWAWIIVLCLLTGCAHKIGGLPPINPYTAALADTWTTHQVVTVSGGTELNPLGVNGSILGKVIYLTLMRPNIKDPEQLYHADRIATGLWSAAASSNFLQLYVGVPFWTSVGFGVMLGLALYETYPR
jgi:hypothetical protein